MKKTNLLKITAVTLATAALPFGVSYALKNPPDMEAIIASAVDFTSPENYITQSIDIGGGDLILYTPAPAETSSVSSETEPPDIQTEPSISQAETDSARERESENDPEDYMITQNISSDREDLSVFDSADGEVENLTFSAGEGENYIDLNYGAQLRNCTELDNDFLKEEVTIPTDIKIELNSSEPQVLIMHTHACESYLVDDSGYYDESYTSRTTDSSQSVVAVGKKIAEKLAENGICVIHDGTLHDHPLYSGAYDRAEETVTAILEKYPSIKAVLDIHRDGIEESDGTRVAAVTEINGKEAAQVMIISAASDGYYYVPDYLQNLHFACLLQEYMEMENSGITRPILFEYCQYNQHLTTGSLLIEVGSHGNTLDQALYTGELIGESIAKALISLTE